MEPCDITQEESFHGFDYIISLKGREDNILLRVEDKLSGNMWKGDFSSKYVEDIAQKTGSFKKFPVFVKMLATAVRQENESVYIDILTAQDLELLKSRKAGNTSGLSQSSASLSSSKPRPPPSTKRYLILTYAGDFDKVHYPLPLSYEENPDPEVLKSTVSRLAKELDQLKSRTIVSEAPSVSMPVGTSTPMSTASAPTELGELVEENETLKKRLSAMESRRVGGAVEMDVLTKESLERAGDYDRYLRESDRELSTLRNRLNETQREFEEVKDELSRTRTELGHFDKSMSSSFSDVEAYRSQLGDLSSTLEIERKEGKATIEENKHKLASTLQDINKYMESDKRMKVRVKQLENELEQALKRVNYNPNSRSSSRSNSASRRPLNTSSRYSPSNYKNTTGSNSSSAKRGSSVPANQRGKAYVSPSTNKRATPNSLRQQPPRNAFRPHYSPSSSLRSNSGSTQNQRGRGVSNTSATRKPYSPSNRLYSPSGAPRNTRAAGRKMGAVDRASPLRAANQTRPKVPPAVRSGNARQSPHPNNRTSNSPAGRGSVFDRLSGGSGKPASRPIKEAANAKPGVKAQTRPAPSKPAISGVPRAGEAKIDAGNLPAPVIC